MSRLRSRTAPFCLVLVLTLVASGADPLLAGEKEDLVAAFEKADALKKRADYPEAAKQYERALALAPRVFGPDALNTATILNNLADVRSIMGQYAKAEPLFQRSLKIYEAKLGSDHSNVAGCLYNLANLYQTIGQYAKAEPLFQRSLRIREAKLGSDHLDVAASLNSLALLCKDTGQYAKAEPLFQRSLRIREAKLGPNHPELAASLNNLAILYVAMGQYAKAEPLFQRSLKIREVKLAFDHPDVAQSLANLANLYKDMGHYSKAEPLYLRSLKIREAKLGPDHPDVAANLTSLANLYMTTGQYVKAESFYQRSLQINEARLGSDHTSVALAINNLATLYFTMGQYAKAEPLYLRSLKIRESKLGPDHPDVAQSLNNLAELYRTIGQYSKAEPLYQRGLRIRETKLGRDHPDVAASVHSLASLYFKMGQYAKAEPLYLRSLKIRESELGPDHPDVSTSLNNLALLYAYMGQYAKAEPLYQRSLGIGEAKLGPDHPSVAIALTNLANLYKNMGQFDKAEPLYQRSLKIRGTALGADHPAVANSLNNLALLYADMGQYAKAEPLYLRSLKINEAKLGSDHPEVALSLDNLAWLYHAMGSLDQAAVACDRSRRVVRKHVAEVLPVLNEKEQLTFLERIDEGRYHRALTFGLCHGDAAKIVESSYGWLANGKAVAGQSLAETALRARDSTDPKSQAVIQELNTERTQLANLSQAVPRPGQEEGHRRQLTELSQKTQELARQVNLAAGRPAQGDPWIETSAIRSALSQDAILLDIVRFEPYIFGAKHGEKYWQPARYVVWLVPPAGQGPVEIVDLGEAGAIDGAVEKARQAIEQSAARIKKPAEDESQAEQAAVEPLGKLAEMVLAPLKPHLAGAKQLILSPDSNLWLMPWGALPVAEGKYAIETWQIRYVTSGRDLVAEQLASRAREQTRPRIFADPDYDLDGKGTQAATRAVLRGKESQLALRSAAGRSAAGLLKVERLPATASEAQLIEPSLESYAHEAPTVYSQQYALEGVLKMIASPKVLVLSTHGFYLPDQKVKPEAVRGELAGLEGRESRGELLTSDGKPLENPLLRCGLLLAGCNQAQSGADDGVVTGMEIVGCDLRGTDLVVLSACQTGLGQVRNSEGVAGLRQAFQLAGAKAVVSTLWRIPDAETATLMSGFFGNLAAGQTKAEALRSAQLAMIKSRRHETGAAHPHYWAAFTVTGN